MQKTEDTKYTFFFSYVSAARRHEKQEEMCTKSADLTLKSEKRIGLLSNTELFL